MVATNSDISRWFDRGIEEEATHLIVVCDSFDYDDYPVYVSKHQDVYNIIEKYKGKSMQNIMEVYKMSLSKDEQMSQERSFNY